MKFLGIIVNTVFTLVVLAVGGLFLLPMLPIDLDVELRIVQSGSMEPTIETGSLILVWPQEQYSVGDVIMFADRNADVPTTHRIIDTVQDGGETRFVTQGDANEDPDNNSVAEKDIYGVVSFAAPKVGYVLDFARQPLGFVFLIVLPALLLILGEVEKIWHEVRSRTRASTPAPVPNQTVPNTPAPVTSSRSVRRMMDIMTPVRFAADYTLDLHDVKFSPAPSLSIKPITAGAVFGVIGIVVMVAAQYLSSTYAYLTDVETAPENQLEAIALDFTAVADGEIYTFEDGELVADEDGSVVTVVMPEPDSDPVHYDVSAEFISGNPTLCSAIVATSTSPVSYAGPLPLLNDSDVLFDAPWSLALALPDETGLFNNDACSLDIVLQAWHFDEASGDGYTDEERIPLSFTLMSDLEAPALASTFKTLSTLSFETLAGDTASTSSTTSKKEIKVPVEPPIPETSSSTASSTQETKAETEPEESATEEESDDMQEEDKPAKTVTILVSKKPESEEEEKTDESAEDEETEGEAEDEDQEEEKEEIKPEEKEEPKVEESETAEDDSSETES